ncbi:MAG: formate dehydrogenase subunit gamma [Acetobacteraceae bacterium]|nr:formate dehydrogenase subunit gamma [Acetobacteraceae bacterium]
MTQPYGTLTRYTLLERINHWITGLCFVLLTLSGLALFHPLLFWLNGLFGGGQWTRAIHPWIGIVLVISYIGLIFQFLRDNLPSAGDGAWIRSLRYVLSNQDQSVPEVGRCNPGQKFVFWAMALLIGALFVSGIVIWQAHFFTYTTIQQQRVGHLVHAIAATGAIVVWIIHVYSAIWVRGSVRAMTRGYVTPGWAWRHHRKWLRELAASGSSGPRPNR